MKFLKPKIRAVDFDGETLHVRSLTLGEIEQLQEMGEGLPAARQVLSLAFVTADGQRLLTDEQIDQVPADVLHQLSELAYSASKSPKVETVAKN